MKNLHKISSNRLTNKQIAHIWYAWEKGHATQVYLNQDRSISYTIDPVDHIITVFNWYHDDFQSDTVVEMWKRAGSQTNRIEYSTDTPKVNEYPF